MSTVVVNVYVSHRVDVVDYAEADKSQVHVINQQVTGPAGLSIVPYATVEEVLDGLEDSKAISPKEYQESLPYFDVRRFGAVGNGVHDDTTAIQRAIDAAEQAAKVGSVSATVVLFPGAGTYLTGPLQLGSRVELRGQAGLAATLKLKAASVSHLISLKAPTTQQVAIKHLYLDGNAANQSAANDGINFTNQIAAISPSVNSGGDCHHFIEDVFVSNTKGNGLTLTGRGATFVSKSFFYFTNGAGVSLNAFDCYFSDVTTGVTDGHGFDLGSGCANTNLIGCKAFLSKLDGFHLGGIQGNRLAGCCAQGNWDSGFHLAGSIDNVLESCTAMDNNYTLSGSVGVGFRLSSNALRNRISGHAFDDQAVHTQVAALSMTPAVLNNQIDLTVNIASHTTGLLYSGSSTAGNSIRINSSYLTSFFQATYAATWTPDLLLGSVQAITLTGPITINRPIGSPIEGAEMVIIINQDATGSRAVTWGTGFVDKFWAPDPTASAISTVRFVFRQNNWYVSGGDFTTSTNTWTQKQILSGEIQIGGPLNHDGSTVGFYGTAPQAQQTGVTAKAALEALGLGASLVFESPSGDLADLVARWTPASAAGAARLDFAEDTDNGTNVIMVIAPAAITSDQFVILPAPATTDTLVARTTTDTLTNKSISGATNTLSAIPESAVTNLVTDLAAKQAASTDLTDLVARWVPASAAGAARLDFAEDTDNGTNVVMLIAPAAIASDQFVILPAPSTTDTIVARATTDTLTNKTVALGSNTVSGTIAQFNTAVTDADLATIAGIETLTGKTLTDAKITKAINAQVGTTYTLVLADDSKLVTLSNAGAITLTVPTNASVAFPIGTEIVMATLAAGQVTITPAGGVSVNSRPGLKSNGQFAEFRLRKIATDTWLASGDLAP